MMTKDIIVVCGFGLSVFVVDTRDGLDERR